ncbi:hypothetical protein ACX80W_04400 [Arthrobacter sp. TMN-37]
MHEVRAGHGVSDAFRHAVGELRRDPGPRPADWIWQEKVFQANLLGAPIAEIMAFTDADAPTIQAAIQQARRRHPTKGSLEDRVPFELHLQIAMHLTYEEGRVRALAQNGLDCLMGYQHSARTSSRLNRWQTILSFSVERLTAVMLENTQQASELRRISPFERVLTRKDRVLAIQIAGALARPATRTR